MHNPNFMMPGWKPVLQEVFRDEPRKMEINGVSKLLNAVAHTLG